MRSLQFLSWLVLKCKSVTSVGRGGIFFRFVSMWLFECKFKYEGKVNRLVETQQSLSVYKGSLLFDMVNDQIPLLSAMFDLGIKGSVYKDQRVCCRREVRCHIR